MDLRTREAKTRAIEAANEAGSTTNPGRVQAESGSAVDPTSDVPIVDPGSPPGSGLPNARESDDPNPSGSRASFQDDPRVKALIAAVRKARHFAAETGTVEHDDAAYEQLWWDMTLALDAAGVSQIRRPR